MKKVKLIALIAALIAGVGIYFFLKEVSKPQEIPHTPVVVAAVDIPENTKITAEMVELRPVVDEALANDHLLDVDSVIGLVTSSEIYAGEQVVSDRLVRMGELDDASDTLSYIVESGMRAMTISVNATTGMENLIKPGNRVDLIVYYTYEDEDEENKKIPASMTLVQNKKVLAVGSELSKNGASEYSTITLEMTPEETVLVSYAESSGSIRVVLRSPLDKEEATTGEVDMNVLREGADNP